MRFVPLIGEQGWRESADAEWRRLRAQGTGRRAETRAARTLCASCWPQPASRSTTSSRRRRALFERIGEARVVLLGEATHGTVEFYRMRARITRELIERKGFTIVAVEADWPDAARIDHYVRDLRAPGPGLDRLHPLPNLDVAQPARCATFVDWLRDHNRNLPAERRAGFYGLDLYSLHTSIDAVLAYLDDVDPEPPRSRATATAASRLGNPTRPPTATRH